MDRLGISLVLCLSALLSACGGGESIYRGLEGERDGVVAVEIGDEETPEKSPGGSSDESAEHPGMDRLSPSEANLVRDQHDDAREKISFIVVSAETGQVLRSYLASKPRRLASVTKVLTALAALREVRNVNVAKVTAMLKSSNNSEASRYVRLAAKAIAGHVTPGQPFPGAASCPAASDIEAPAAVIAMGWLQRQRPQVDWDQAIVKDGAGCDYRNHMTAGQTIETFAFADSLGTAFGGRSFEQLLSVAGVDGTWAHRNTDARGRIFAKTGTLNFNSNMAGYFYARQGETMQKYLFAVFVEKQPGAQSTQRSRGLIESLLRYWINLYSRESVPPILTAGTAPGER